MFRTTVGHRVVILVDASLRSQILQKIMEMGATGYNCVPCQGRGRHSITGEAFFSDELVRIEMITSHETSKRILDYIHDVQFHQFGQYPLMTFFDTVGVDARDRSLPVESTMPRAHLDQRVPNAQA